MASEKYEISSNDEVFRFLKHSDLEFSEDETIKKAPKEDSLPFPSVTRDLNRKKSSFKDKRVPTSEKRKEKDSIKFKFPEVEEDESSLDNSSQEKYSRSGRTRKRHTRSEIRRSQEPLEENLLKNRRKMRAKEQNDDADNDDDADDEINGERKSEKYIHQPEIQESEEKVWFRKKEHTPDRVQHLTEKYFSIKESFEHKKTKLTDEQNNLEQFPKIKKKKRKEIESQTESEDSYKPVKSSFSTDLQDRNRGIALIKRIDKIIKEQDNPQRRLSSLPVVEEEEVAISNSIFDTEPTLSNRAPTRIFTRIAFAQTCFIMVLCLGLFYLIYLLGAYY